MDLSAPIPPGRFRARHSMPPSVTTSHHRETEISDHHEL
jgi:hypothetical protein